jgi:MFS family permease
MTDVQQKTGESQHTRTFIACFVALVATSFAFIIRAMLMGDWQQAFNLSETQKGEIFGAGLWPFGVSIVLFSLIIDKVGYAPSMIFAFVCHVASAVLLFNAKGYGWLYVGSILNGLAAGTVEAVINPAVASMYTRHKTRMLSVLHAGWPAGLVLGGLFVLLAPGGVTWQHKVLIVLLPVILYGVLMITVWTRFPRSERVLAGVPYRDMLKEAGAASCFIVMYLIATVVSGVIGIWTHVPPAATWAVIIGTTLLYFAYTRSLGQPMYVFLLLVMLLLATTELGIDSWVTDLMNPAMSALGHNAGWVLVYTSLIMMILRFCIAPIERALKPLGVLLVCAILAAVGLNLLSFAKLPATILLAATVYGVGKTFFWPVTLGVVAERFPKGGALTLNAIAGVGMLAVGVLGNPVLGHIQDTQIRKTMEQGGHGAVYAEMAESRTSIFGTYQALDVKKEAAVTASRPEVAAVVADAKSTAKGQALRRFSLLPSIMALCYLGLIILFAARGGYRAVELQPGAGKT